MITRDQIEALQSEAEATGDFLQAAYCRIALSEGGEHTYAHWLCEQAILNGRG